jgi:hypothetical protein
MTRSAILLALCTLLSACSYGPECGPDGFVVRFQEIRGCLS